MQEELDELYKQEVGDLVELLTKDKNNKPIIINPSETRQVYKIKIDNNNNPIRYKSRLVVQGYN